MARGLHLTGVYTTAPTVANVTRGEECEHKPDLDDRITKIK
jgi:hypothetical protein